ncbi:hypothetical protein KR018_010141 [Drosophila ironensis]|nr:hypothetical protein KR018_010141 [Drosophila ironensis]
MYTFPILKKIFHSNWISILFSWLVICHEVEPRAIPPAAHPHPQIEGKVKNKALPEKTHHHTNQTIPEYFVFTLPDGRCLRIIYHINGYGFYPETID